VRQRVSRPGLELEESAHECGTTRLPLASVRLGCLDSTRRHGIEVSMNPDRPGMLIRKQVMELLAAHGEAEVFR